jgi:CheY-like chemotaxis protein
MVLHPPYGNLNEEVPKDVKKALVVDDDALVCKVLTSIVGKVRCDCDSALSAEEALGLIEKNRYDVILTDYRMPGMNGIELIRKIRVISPHSIVILITSCMDDEVAGCSGADIYIQKPFYVDAVKEILDRTLHEMPNTG